MDCKKIGEYIQLKRKQAGLTQVQLGDALGITSKAVSKWETGVAIPDISLFSELTKILNITVEELLQGEDNKKNDDNKKINIKIILYIIIGLLIILSCSLVIYFKSNYSRVNVYRIESRNKDFHVDGTLMIVDDKSYFSISNVEYVDNDVEKFKIIHNFRYELYYNGNLLYDSNKAYERNDKVEFSLSDKVANINLFFDDIVLKNDVDPYFSLRIFFDDIIMKNVNIDILLKVI
jgi:transcriptional regulator with XRE-family HTH domain